jgi:hypothetical protein
VQQQVWGLLHLLHCSCALESQALAQLPLRLCRPLLQQGHGAHQQLRMACCCVPRRIAWLPAQQLLQRGHDSHVLLAA